MHGAALFHQQQMIGKLRCEVDVVRDDEGGGVVAIAAISN
jgi:hypothetical protein